MEVLDPQTPEESGQNTVAVPIAQALSQADILTQVDIAKRYPRDVARFMRDLRRIVTASQEIAESCFYVLKRTDRRTGEIKRIEGRSIRFAEMAASEYGNVRYGARGVEIGEQFVTVTGVAIDLQRNIGVEQPATRRITTSGGQRYGEDMIGVTIGAAVSIAMRNALNRVIPLAYTEGAYEAAKEAAVGDAKSLQDRRQKIIGRFQQMGVSVEEILRYVDRPSSDFINREDLEDLIGLGTAIKEGTQTIDEAFGRTPKTATIPNGKMGFGKSDDKAKTETPKADPATEQAARPSEPVQEAGPDYPVVEAAAATPAASTQSDNAALAREARAREQAEASQEGSSHAPPPRKENGEKNLMQAVVALGKQKGLNLMVLNAWTRKQFGTGLTDCTPLQLQDLQRTLVAHEAGKAFV